MYISVALRRRRHVNGAFCVVGVIVYVAQYD